MARISNLINKGLAAVIFILLSIFGFSQDTSEDNQKLKLLVHDFVKDTVHSRSNDTLDVSTGVNTSFTNYDELELLKVADYPAITIDSLMAGNMSGNQPGLDIVVFGTYVIVNEYVRIQPVIYDANEKLFHSLSLSRGTVVGMDILVDEVAGNIFESLVEISPVLQSSKKRIAIVGDFETVSGVYKNIGGIRAASQDYARQIIQDVEYRAPENANVLSWTEIRSFNGESTVEMIREMDLDMLIRLTFIFDNEQLVGMKTDFDILERNKGQIQKREFILPQIKVDYYADYDFMDFAVTELSDFLERIISESGQWDYIAFPNKSSTKPTKADLLIYKAENFATKNEFFLSSYHYYEALNEFPETVNPVDIRLQIGFNKVYLYRLEEANEEFDFILSQDAENGYAYLGKSLINYYNGNYDEALSYLETASQKGFDNDFLIDVMRGYYYFELGNHQDALDNFNKALKADQKIIRIRIVNSLEIATVKVHVGLCYLALNQFDNAISYYEDLIKEFPYNDDLPYYLGNAHSKKGIEEYFAGNYIQAIADFYESRKTYPNSNINDYLRAALIFEKRFQEANTFIEEEIEKGNYDPLFIWMTHALDIRQMFIDQYRSSGSFDGEIGAEAIAVLNKSLELDENKPRTYYYIGEIYTLSGDDNKGLEYMEKAYALDNTDFDIQLGLMQAYILTNQLETAEKLSRKVSRINRKLNVDSRTNALMDFLVISASLPQEKKAKREMKSLNQLLKENVIIDQWFYDPYLEWLDECSCDAGTKKTLADLTEDLKAKDLD